MEAWEAGDLLDGRLCALGHEALRRRRDRLVLGTDQIPGGDRLPRRRPGRRAQRRSAPRALGRRHDACGLRVDVGSKSGRESLLIEIKVHTLGAVGVRERDLPERGQHQAALVQPEELLDALPLIKSPPGDEHQRLDLVVTGRGVGDDRAAVRMGDKDHRPLDRPQERAEVRRVAAQPSQRVRHPDRAVALAVQGADRAVEAGGVGPSAVDKDDRRSVAAARGAVHDSSLIAMPVLGMHRTPPARYSLLPQMASRASCLPRRCPRYVSAKPIPAVTCAFCWDWRPTVKPAASPP